MVKQEPKILANEVQPDLLKRGRGGRSAVPFPRNSLKESLEIPRTIWKENAGQPYDPIMIAKSLKTTVRSSKFTTLLTSSERYGLTQGGVFAKAISITELGKDIVGYTDETRLGGSLRQALLKPDVFKQAYEKYDRHNTPPPEPAKATFERQFGVPRADVDACYNVWKKNIDDYKLSIQSGGATLLYLDNLGKATATAELIPKGDEVLPPEGKQKDEVTGQKEEPTPQTPPAQEQIVKIPRVFISHSKNKKILENMKQTLTFGKFDYRVAEEKETLSMPLSDKVFGLMRECNCAIINVSADQEKKQGETYAINENVLIEIGAAFLHYDKRVLLVIDKRLEERLPSILQGITAIFYEGQELSLSDGMKLMKVLDEFRNKL